MSRSTTLTVFLKWIDLMYERIRFLIVWPHRDELISTMPLLFRKYFKTKVAVIIDFFEVFISKPSNLKARNSTFCNINTII